MNHHMPPHGQMHNHPHHPSRRQQDYNLYHHHHQPQGPMHHHNPYAAAAYPHPTFYPNQPPQYPPQRWQHPQHYQQQQPPPYMQHGPPPVPQPPPQQLPHHQQPYQPRSPLVVSSTPYNQSMPHLTRQSSNQMTAYPQHNAQSPRPMSQHMMQQQQQYQQFQPQHQPQPQISSPTRQQTQGPALQQSQYQQPQTQPQPPLQTPQQQLHTQTAVPSPPPTPKQEPSSEQTPVQQPAVAASREEDEEKEKEKEKEDTSKPQSTPPHPLSLPPEHKQPFYPTLPWYSSETGASAFPRRESARRKRRQNLLQPVDGVALPARETSSGGGGAGEEQAQTPIAEEHRSDESTVAGPSEGEGETPATSQAPSEDDFALNTASGSVSTAAAPAVAKAATAAVTGTQQARRDTRTAVAVPIIPGLNQQRASPASAATERPETRGSAATEAAATTAAATAQAETAQADTQAQVEGAAAVEAEAVKTAPPAAAKPPGSWADLLRRNAPAASAANIAFGSTNGFAIPKSASLGDALRQYDVKNDSKLWFLEPRGLVNTGNMCYMNSILQVLLFSNPFYNFLDQVRTRTVHSLSSKSSETPLVDAMIMFMKEFKVLASADSPEILRMRLPQQLLEVYGEPVTPEYVYDAIRPLDRFISMRRGHQQDAEEFLGFLLEGLHDECVAVMARQTEEAAPSSDDVTSPSSSKSPTSGDGWLEVGPKQKASITRHAGSQDTPSPITKIFGGHLRSELRVPGLKDSVTLEPYKPLQLDIGSPQINNIVDALKGITRSESLTGDFGGRGGSTGAKKQVFIDTLPPILILHLKRFQYDLTGTQKIWKKVGYPLELEIPREVFPPSKRNGFAVKGGLPKYRLNAVVYHHGKSAAGGHYTVDILRADGREWVRMDDTVIRRIRPEDVAEGGAEEDPKVLARALEQHKADQDLQSQQKQRNIFQGLDDGDEDAGSEEERPWSEVNGASNNVSASAPAGSAGSAAPAGATKKWSSIATAAATNGTATPTSTTGKRTPTAAASSQHAGRKEGVKDNKVAYILLYERMSQ